ncbi:protein of unknown function [Legionella micdadei]|uniref:Uncharacterized protein n=1 Tax=Legionella micdadei TaxID=451 RepID=A0A098GGF5_LEGMI|nr:hypothetical protein Lmic_1657 [Legionella micdadei]CEG60561.1 protein of unknown function [Legionella micdadei]SCX81722.1 hypothetical protein SAMN02982997_00143 [Legionella micdadei]
MPNPASVKIAQIKQCFKLSSPLLRISRGMGHFQSNGSGFPFGFGINVQISSTGY